MTSGAIPPAAVSRAIDRARHIDHGIVLGMSPLNLLQKLGPPATDETKGGRRIVSYTTTSDADDRVSLSYEAHYEFVKDRLVPKQACYDAT